MQIGIRYYSVSLSISDRAGSYGASTGFATISLTGEGEDNPYTITNTTTLTGVFSVSADRKVRFAGGNLVYDVPRREWGFYDQQYQRAVSCNYSSSNMFTWGAGSWSTVPNTGSFLGSDEFVDWGTFLDGEIVWRTLSCNEWKYLVSHHTPKLVMVCEVRGYLFCPDGFQGQTADSYDESSWAEAEKDGLLFLPCTGYRDGARIYNLDSMGRYWTSTSKPWTEQDCFAYSLHFTSAKFQTDASILRKSGAAVRLVTDYSEDM